MTYALILDDQPLFADSFALMLEKNKLFDQVFSFYTTADLIDFLSDFGNNRVHIFLDYYLKNENGLTAVSDIRRLNKKSKIIFLTSTTSSSVIAMILQIKPSGIISKFCDFHTVKNCLESENEVFMGEYIREIQQKNELNPSIFTPREIELLQYFADGFSVAQTAEKLFLSQHTVIAHRKKMMAKSNCHSIAQLLKVAKDRELI